MATNDKPWLGLDLGYVITNGSIEDMLRELKRGRRDFRSVPHVPGAFKGVRRLVDRWFGSNVSIISACPEELKVKLLEWLGAHAFYSRTGVPYEGHIHFCREYADKVIFARSLHLTHMVDDRPETLIPMRGIVPHLFLFNPDPDALGQFQNNLHGIVIVWNWAELVAAIGATIREKNRRARHGQRKQKALRRRRAH